MDVSFRAYRLLRMVSFALHVLLASIRPRKILIDR
jgi:hypothetical protein